jgi:hypothetical protein
MTTTPTARSVSPAPPTTDVVEAEPAPAAHPERRLVSNLQRVWQLSWRPGLIYLASRALVLLTMGIVAVIGGGSLGDRIDRWDSVWYLRVISRWTDTALHGTWINGYPSHLPMVDGHVAANTLAFFPGLPLLIRALSGLTGMSQFSSGVVVSSLTGLTATIGVWMLVREYAGERAANRATMLFAFFGGSFVFSMIYSEGLVITGAAFGLLALMRRRWILAGLLGFVATAAAPIALAFTLSCAWAAGLAVARRREWKSLAAPVLAPMGTIAYLVWTWQYTGTLAAFTRTERGGWNSYLSIAYPFKIIWANLAHPISTTANPRLVFFCLIGVVIAVIITVRDRQPAPIAIYGIAVGVLALLTQPVGPRPRIILDAFPLILAVALRYKEGWKYQVALYTSVAFLVGMTAYTVGSWTVFP